MARSLEELEASLETETLAAIAWMVADGLLEFRIACPANDLDGDFHDKFGVFSDAAGDRVAFHGSPNDSAQAFRNYESISAFYSWIDDRETARIDSESERFQRLWDNHDANVRTFTMPEAIKRNLIFAVRQFQQRAQQALTLGGLEGAVAVALETPRFCREERDLALLLICGRPSEFLTEAIAPEKRAELAAMNEAASAQLSKLAADLGRSLLECEMALVAFPLGAVRSFLPSREVPQAVDEMLTKSVVALLER